MQFNPEQQQRYARNLLLPEVGHEGQQRLLNGRVLVVGVGGLGSPAALHLAAAGVGTIGLMDGDTVDLTNLQRQIIHSTLDIDRPKTTSASEKLAALNPGIQVVTYAARLTADNALDVLREYDFVIDATDNFPSKFLVADACHFADTPYVHCGVAGCTGQMLTVLPGRSTCYRCVFNAPPPGAVDRSQAGVLGVVPGVLGTLQAAEAIKFLLNRGHLLIDRLLMYDGLRATFREVELRRNPACPLCGNAPSVTTFGDASRGCAAAAGEPERT